MPYTKIRTTANTGSITAPLPTAAGALPSSSLMHALRDDAVWLDQMRQCLGLTSGSDDSSPPLDTGLLSTGAGGHFHRALTHAFEWQKVDQFTVTAGVNDRLDFEFADGSHAKATYAASLTAGTRDAADTASHVQTQMRSVTGSTKLTVSFVTTAGAKNRGLFTIQNTETGSTRTLNLLFGSGVNGPLGAARSAARLLGYSERDQRGNYGYPGESGFFSGLIENKTPLGDGGLIDSPGICGTDLSSPYNSPAVLRAKIADNTVPAAALATDSIQTANIIDKSITGVKSASGSHAGFNPGGGGTVIIGQPTGSGATRTPRISIWGKDVPVKIGDVVISSISHGSGDTWNVTYAGTAPVGTAEWSWY